jgi:hypothetical protein
VPAATLTPNPAGNAKADFRTRPNRGNGSGKVKPHRKKKPLTVDPRRKEILVQLVSGPTRMFVGPMLAQIEGLNACSPTATDSPLTGDTGSGVAALELEENCETAFDVEIAGVPEGMYDLYVNGDYADGPIATIDAADDGSGAGTGTGTGFVRFDPSPDPGEDELPLDFEVGSGSRVEVFTVDPDAEPEADPNPDLLVLSGTLL